MDAQRKIELRERVLKFIDDHGDTPASMVAREALDGESLHLDSVLLDFDDEGEYRGG